MTETFIYDVIRKHRLAVLATTSADGQPEAAVVGIAVTTDLEIVFDTLRMSRKYRNLHEQPKVAMVIGMKNEVTTQYEGVAAELLRGEEDDRYREAYYAVFPEGRERAATWEGLVHFVIRPRWIRYSNYNEPVMIEEMKF